MTEVRGQRTEVRGQRTEVRGQRTEVRGQRTEVRGQRTEVRGPVFVTPAREFAGQAEDRGQKAEGTHKVSGVRFQVSGKTEDPSSSRRRVTSPGKQMTEIRGQKVGAVFACIPLSLKKTEQSETILRHSAVRYSTFCGF